jgi:hypothetical protein
VNLLDYHWVLRDEFSKSENVLKKKGEKKDKMCKKRRIWLNEAMSI